MTGELPAAIENFSLVRAGSILRLLQAMLLARPAAGLGVRAVAFFCVLTWLPPLVLSALQGTAVGDETVIHYLLDIPVAVRFLVSIPLMVAAESIVGAAARRTVGQIVRSGLVSGHSVPKLERIVQIAQRCSGSTLAELAGVAAVVFGTAYLRFEMTDSVSSWKFVAGSAGELRTPAGWWYLLVSIPVFQFLLYRWLWRYLIWTWMLWRISRLDLRVVPAHPDRAAGLGIFGLTQTTFGILAIGASSVISAEYAQEFLIGASTIEHAGPIALGLVLLMLVVFLGPLFVFSDVLVRAQWQGLEEYGALAEKYALGFERKWIRGKSPAGKSLLGNADIQSLADMAASYEVVREIRLVPIDPRTVLLPMVACIVLPLFPAALAVVPVDEILRQIASRLL